MARKRIKLALSEDVKKKLTELQEEIDKNKPPNPFNLINELEIWRNMHDEEKPRIYLLDGKQIENKAAIEAKIAERWILSHLNLSERITTLEKELSQLRRKALNDAKSKIGKTSIFICHASEDKNEVARPLAEMLCDLSISVWYDEYTLKLGDSLRRSIEEGLAKSNYGVVIISPSFFKKEWTNFELDGLTSKEMLGSKVILPVWHNISKEEIVAVAPSLASKIAANTKDGLQHVVSLIVNAIA